MDRKTVVNPRLEQVKTVVSRETSSWDLVPQNSGSWEEAGQCRYVQKITVNP